MFNQPSAQKMKDFGQKDAVVGITFSRNFRKIMVRIKNLLVKYIWRTENVRNLLSRCLQQGDFGQ